MSDTKLPGIPEVPLGAENKAILDSLKIITETREGLRGSVEERAITGQDLIDLGLATKADLEQMLRER